MKKSKLVFLLCCSMIYIPAQAQSKDSLDVIKATEKFVKAFTSFDWNNFRNFFATDASIFFPDWEEGTRKTGQKQIEETWLSIFPEFIDSSNKFKLIIEPKNLAIQLYNSTAIVTFHLGDGKKFLFRRTLVFIKENDVWKIVHLHASRVAPEKK